MLKKVSVLIPLAVIGVFAAAQLYLGTSPLIAALCVAAVAIPFLPLWLYGRDLYGLLSISFSLKYVGFALAAKTFYWQTLESNLHDPYAAFGLTLLLMIVLTAMFILARALDPGKAIFSFPMDLASLRRLSVFCICIGIAGTLFVHTGDADSGEAPSGGAAIVLGNAFREFYFFGIIAESFYAVSKTSGRSFVTLRLVFLLLLQVMMSITLNERGAIVTSLIGIVSVAFLYNIIRIRHLVIGAVLGSFFIFVFTPITIYLRFNKAGLSLSEFVVVAEDTIIRAATDPDFFKLISDTQRNAFFDNMNAVVPYDYYGVRSEVLERLSFVSLVDAVYNGTRTREPLGMEAVGQTLARAAPGFLGYDKEIANSYGPGDWLSWHTGLAAPDIVSFTVFGLPMEGLAAWGLTGMIVYPFIFMLPVVYVCGRLSTFRLPLPASVFLFVVIQHIMLDMTADVFLTWMTRNLPALLLSLFVLHYLVRTRVVISRVACRLSQVLHANMIPGNFSDKIMRNNRDRRNAARRPAGFD